ncbi:MAG: glycosyltransferase family 2 protein [Terriglobia bacterium]
MDLVSIIVVNFNGNKWLKPCMEALSGQTYGDIEVIVVDNGSTDGSVEELKKGFPSVSVLENEANAGFAQAVNQGIEATTGQYVVPLNPDVVLTPSYVSEMVETANIGPKVGSVSGKLLRSDEKNSKIIDSVGHLMFKNRLSANRGDEEVDRGQYEVLEPVFGTCGAAALYKRGMLEDIKIGGEYFDETFFAFWEDVDLDWRANLMGWTCLYTPRALAYHYRGGLCLGRGPEFASDRFHRRV